jgi:hypothetical protein
LGAAPIKPLPAQTKQADDAATFDRQIRPLFTKYCQTCHSGNKPEGDFSFETIKTSADLASKPDLLDTMLQYLRDGDMPPVGEPQPTQQEKERIIKWLEGQIRQTQAKALRNPGRVTMRRLNRTEYNNTIHDLTGVRFKPADDFPSDDVGYGFDNIGDVLTLPPTLMEKYLNAAQQIVDEAMLPKPNLNASIKKRYPASAFLPENKKAQVGPGKSARILNGKGDIRLGHEFFRDAEYAIRVRAYGESSEKELPHLIVKLDRQTLGEYDVKAAEASPETFQIKTQVTAGFHDIVIRFSNEAIEGEAKDGQKKERKLVLAGIEVEGPLGLPAKTEPHPILISAPGADLPSRDAARKVLARFAERAFRRPVAASEVDRLMVLFDKATKRSAKYEEALKLPLQAILISPHFLFRVELDTSTAQKLNDFELASRLSYFLWSTMPDETLFDLGRHVKLSNPEELARQAERLLRDSRSAALVENFAGQWLQLRNLKLSTPDPKRFPAFDEPLRAAMQRETELFVTEVVQKNLPLSTFLDADFTFVNERLAKHYGIPDVKGKEFRKVSLAATTRRGIMTQASILTLTSNPTRTSPVKRGKWVLETILGTPPPPPVPNAGDLQEGEELKGTLRQRMEQHRANPTCASCHNRMDPIGFGFENFDAIGAWRTKDGTFPIEPGGTLPSGQSFQTPLELVAVLKQRDGDFRRCFTEKMLTYALGRGLESGDRIYVADIAKAAAGRGDTVSALIQEIVTSEPFRFRRSAKGGT